MKVQARIWRRARDGNMSGRQAYDWADQGPHELTFAISCSSFIGKQGLDGSKDPRLRGTKLGGSLSLA